MKHSYWFLALILLLIPIPSWALSTNCFILDQNKNLLLTIGPDMKVLRPIKTGPCPAALEPMPNSHNYLLMCQGVSNLFGNKPGELITLDSNLQPTNQKIILPGPITQDFYLKNSNTWIFITKSADHTSAQVNVLNLISGEIRHFNLNSSPIACQFNTDNSILAVITTGSTESKIIPQLVLIELHDLTSKYISLSENPKGVFFINENKVLIAYGDYPANPVTLNNIVANSNAQGSVKAHNTSLQWIDTATGDQTITSLGFSPLVIVQDQNDPETFYTASRNDAYDKDAGGTFCKITKGQFIFKLNFQSDPFKIIQTQSGNIGLLCRNNFEVIDPKEAKTLNSFNYTSSVENLLLNQDQSLGFLMVSGSNNLDIIDMASGKKSNSIKLNLSFFGQLTLDALWPSKFPAVSGMILPTDGKPDFSCNINQLIMNKDCSYLYSLSNHEIDSIKLATGKKTTLYQFFWEKPLGICFTPDGRLITVITDSSCYLLNPAQKKPVLTVPIYELESENIGGTRQNTPSDHMNPAGYFAPDGTTLVIWSENHLHFIDCQNGKLISKANIHVLKGKLLWVP
ncbi:MAG TPA: hypothetical protein DDW50_04460 [Firmicutes bacterium]|nr:hypothetical protein [Bacillota bacterium]